MSWWRAKYTNDHGEYEIIFGSKYYERAKAVEKVCQAVIDKAVKTKDDITVVKHGRWIAKTGRAKCSVCADECWADSALEYTYCPTCGAKMDLEEQNDS